MNSNDNVPVNGETSPAPEAPAAVQEAVPAGPQEPETGAAPSQPEAAAQPQEEAVEPATASPEPAGAEAAPGETARKAEMSVKACAAKLRELFPALFAGRPKPLKLRIQQDINARCPGLFPKQTLSALLRRYTMTDAYLQAVSTQTHRYDLDGQPAGELSEEHRRIATETLKQRRAREEERLASERAAEAERLQRASLLSAFETTTLTRENFCALKGVDPAELDALLARAREERQQRKQFLSELLESFRASGQNVPAFAAARRMHPAQLDRLLREASGDHANGRGRGGPGPREERRGGGERREAQRRHDRGAPSRGPRGTPAGPSAPRAGKGSGRPPRG